MRNRIALLAAAAFIASAPLSYAVGPESSSVNVQPKIPTYSASFAALTPAASATDLVVLTGSATKTVRLESFKCTGTSTAAASQVVSLTVRTTADSGGTAVTAPTIFAHSASDPAATAVLSAYSANPTLGTSGGILDLGLLQTPAPASIGAVNGVDFEYNYNDISERRKEPSLTGVANQIAFNMGGVSIATGGVVACTVTWTEN